MNKAILSMLMLAFSAASINVWAKCESNPKQLIADYQITTLQQGGKSITQELQVIRSGNTVVHRYPSTHISEAWYLTQHQLIKPTRYFDEYQRAIEYQPAEKVHGKFESDWSYRYQLLSDALLVQLTLVNDSGKDCTQLQEFRLSSADKTVVLHWLPALQLVKSFKITTASTSQSWSLQSLDYEDAKISTVLQSLENYKTTDFADIGDDHTDPFLTKMVTLGFIEQGASGFYNSHGEALEGQHQH